MASDDTPTPGPRPADASQAGADGGAAPTGRGVIVSHKPEPPKARSADAAGADALTHELANLVDASMRNLGLALGRIRASDDALDGFDADALRQLEAAGEGLRHIAQLLARWRGDQRAPTSLYSRGHKLGDVIDAVAAMLRPAAEAHRIALDIDLPANAADIPAGPLFPVVYNAAQNGLEAILARRRETPADGDSGATSDRVTIDLCLEGDDLMLRVSDTGVGLSQARLDDAGWPRAGVSTKAGGSGLGLAIAREVVVSLGGTVRLGPRPGVGACFEARLPRPALPHDIQ